MKSTKKALVVSILSVMLCVTMLLGTTYAWFTDSVTSGKNVIAAGNLDIELEYTDDGTTWTPVTSGTSLFDNDAVWEPGHTEVAYLRLSNKGKLALKYRLEVSVAKEVFGTSVSGGVLKLSDYIKMGVVENWDGTVYADRDAARDAVSGAGVISTFSKSGSMLAGDNSAITFAIVVYMPESVENEANYKTGTTPPSIELGVSVAATQLTKESDSFDELYDSCTPWLGMVGDVPAETDGAIIINTAEQLAGFAKSVNDGDSYEGKTVKLGKNIDLNNVLWTPVGCIGNGFKGTFDGQGYTISNLYTTRAQYNGFFGKLYGATVTNVVFDKATVEVENWGAVVAGYTACGGDYITNCTVKNSTVTGIFNADGTDNSDNAAAVIGFVQPGGNDVTISNNKVENVTIQAYRKSGAIVGFLNGSIGVGFIMENNSVNGLNLIVDNTHNYKNFADNEPATHLMGTFVGGLNGGTVSETNTAVNVKVNKISPIVIAEGATDEQIQNAVNGTVAAAASGDTVVLPNTDSGVKLPNVGSGVIVKGDGTTKINAGGSGSIANVNDAILEGLVIDCGQSNYHGFQHSDAVIKDCTINGLLFSYNNGGEQVFENCTFVQTNKEYNMWAYGSVTYKNCTFMSYGKFVNVYNEGTAHFDVNFEGCTFINLGTEANKSGINVKDTSGSNQLNITVNITDCTYEGIAPETTTSETLNRFNAVVQLDDIGTGTSKVKIVQDGTILWPAA